jgi:N6-L-threonylcarbamoyladenine synthase
MARDGDDRAVDLPRPRFTHADRNPPPTDLTTGVLPPGLDRLVEFSFSGLKTAVVRHLAARGVPVATGLTVPTDAGPMSRQEVADFCASFQRVVVESLVDRTFAAARALGARSIGIAGGVSANSRLRHDAAVRGECQGVPVLIPSLALSTDNAAMIAAAGLRKLARGETAPLDFNAEAALPIA